MDCGGRMVGEGDGLGSSGVGTKSILRGRREARMAEPGVRFLGRGSKPSPQQIRGLVERFKPPMQ